MKKAYVFLADGFEEVEGITPIGYLRRAGVGVTVVGVTGPVAVSARDISVVCDRTLDGLAGEPLPDLAVLPGGARGSRNLAASAPLRDLVSRMSGAGRIVGALCASPAVVLAPWGLLDGREWTCYPGAEDGLGVTVSEKRVVVDGPFVTSRGAGTAEEFSLALIAVLLGESAAERVRSEIVAR